MSLIESLPRVRSLRLPRADGLIPWIVPLAIILIWQLACVTGFVSARVLPAPSDVALAGWKLLLSGELVRNIWVSFWRASIGFLIGGSIGFAFGLANGLSQLSSKLTDTTLQMVRNIPHLALIPLVILWFGIDESAKLFLVALGVFFPIYLNTLHGIRTVDPQLIEMGRIYGMTDGELFRRVIFPGRAAVDLRRPALCARHHVADADRGGNHRGVIRPRLHGDAGARVHADRRRGALHPDLRVARKAGRQRLARAGAADAVLASGLPETLRIEMQEALRFRAADAEAVDSPDFVKQARLSRRDADALLRGLSLTIRGLRKSFGDNEVLRGIDLHIPAGQSVAIVGRSGCGKSTLLRLIAGLETATAGTISFGEETRPEDIRVMFQEPRLLPWARVLSNVEVGLGRDGRRRMRKRAPKARWSKSALTTNAGNGRRFSPADRSSAWRWRGHWSAVRACWPSTSRSARWMR